MKITINLASEPFRRNRPILVASVALCLLLATTLTLLVVLARLEHQQAAGIRAAVQEAEREASKLSAEQNRLEEIIRRPENTEVLERSVFLNTLLARKAVSWTRIFSDLEKVMPHNVRLISVRPQVGEGNQILLDMVVGAQSGEPVITMLRRLESAPQFGPTTVHNWLPPSQTEPLYRYRVSVQYAQKL